MKYRLLLTREATQDAIDGFEWYENKQQGLGKKFFDELDRYFQRITEFPNQFPKDQNQHIAVVKTFPYRIVFEIDEKQITVFSIYHDKRGPRRHADRST
jgi:plasmid stabilization system protein ParE